MPWRLTGPAPADSHGCEVQCTSAAVGRGDVATVFDKLDETVERETTVPLSDVPWLQARRGKASIVGFVESMAPLETTRLETHTIFDGGDKGLVLIKFEVVAPGQEPFVPQQWSPLAAQRGWQGRQARPRRRHRSNGQDGQGRMTIAGATSRRMSDRGAGQRRAEADEAAHLFNVFLTDRAVRRFRRNHCGFAA